MYLLLIIYLVLHVSASSTMPFSGCTKHPTKPVLYSFVLLDQGFAEEVETRNIQ